MFENIFEYLLDEITLIAFISVFVSITFSRINKSVSYALITISFILLVDMLNMSLMLVELSNNEPSKKFNHYAIYTETDTVGVVINNRVIINPYWGSEYRQMFEFDIISKFRSKFIYSINKNILSSEEFVARLYRKLPICFEDSIGSLIYFQLNNDTLFIEAKVNDVSFVDSINISANEAVGFLAAYVKPIKVKIRINEMNTAIIDQNKIIKEDYLFFNKKKMRRVDNPFVKLWQKIIGQYTIMGLRYNKQLNKTASYRSWHLQFGLIQ